ncbi:TPA: hypothetical protein ACJEU7_002406 [Acinetobacter baumannii]|uniref:hypothetical protein n=1 Tax=Acinetobacter baumannii TaxID=470 RepID=UPI0022568FEE|nr:hypothetical protein [Acinetobacter baumannii]MCX3034140.1 hypothetical protein [Acinetobacter baumannii]
MNNQLPIAEKMEALDKIILAIKETQWGEQFAIMLTDFNRESVLETVNTEEVEGVNRNYNMFAITSKTDTDVELKIEFSNYSMDKPNTTNFQTIGDVNCELFVNNQEFDGDEGIKLLDLLNTLISYISEILINNTFGITFEEFQESCAFSLDTDLLVK